MKLYKDEAWLRRQYDLDKKTTYKIGKIAGCSGRTISSWLKRFNIERRKGGTQAGSHPSAESKEKMSASHRGIKHSAESRAKISAAQYRLNKRGEKSPNWKGGRMIQGGYIYIYLPRHPNASKTYMRENRIIAEKKIGRYLKPGEVAHHKDGNPMNNKAGNILVCSRGEHMAIHNHLRQLKKATK